MQVLVGEFEIATKSAGRQQEPKLQMHSKGEGLSGVQTETGPKEHGKYLQALLSHNSATTFSDTKQSGLFLLDQSCLPALILE